MPITERGIASEGRGGRRNERASLGNVVRVIECVTAAGFEIRRKQCQVEWSERGGECIRFQGIVTAESGVTSARDDEWTIRDGRGLAEIRGQFAVECFRLRGGEAAGIGQDVEARGRGL